VGVRISRCFICQARSALVFLDGAAKFTLLGGGLLTPLGTHGFVSALGLGACTNGLLYVLVLPVKSLVCLVVSPLLLEDVPAERIGGDFLIADDGGGAVTGLGP
jgi:hypothetical protein